jgi:hypothetical protein
MAIIFTRLECTVVPHKTYTNPICQPTQKGETQNHSGKYAQSKMWFLSRIQYEQKWIYPRKGFKMMEIFHTKRLISDLEKTCADDSRNLLPVLQFPVK